MISGRLIELISIHSSQLTSDVASDLATNEHTPGFRKVPLKDLEPRIYELFNHLGQWISDPNAARVEDEFSEWGRRRFDQGIPLSEIVYAVLVIKRHLRRYIGDHGLIDASFPRMEREYVLPMHLHSLQDLNTRVGEFFDAALYHLARGHEEAGVKA